MHHQDAYEDNGDGEISPCDRISLDGEGYHITWVGPTYYLVPCGTTDPPGMFEPEDPTCEVRTEVRPDNGDQWHVDDWGDNGDGVVSECDQVFIDGVCNHIEYIGLHIRVQPAGPVDTERSTWGEIKDQD